MSVICRSLFIFVSSRSLPPGDRVGRLWPNRGQEGVHGSRSNNAGRPEPVQYRHWMVQAVWNDVTGQWAAQFGPL